MTRVIKGELKGSHITNNFFDVLFLMPQVSYKLNTDHFGKIAEPKEKVSIKNCIKYCRQDGVIYMTLPATRIAANFAFYLSKVLSDNTIIVKEPDSSLERITIIGQKHISQKSKPELYEKLKYMRFLRGSRLKISVKALFITSMSLITLRSVINRAKLRLNWASC